MRKNWEYRRGDIYLANLDPVVGAEIGGIRPVLILQNNTGNFFSPTLIAAPLTSNVDKKPNQPTHFLLEQVRGLNRPSMVILSAGSSDTWDGWTAVFCTARNSVSALR